MHATNVSPKIPPQIFKEKLNLSVLMPNLPPSNRQKITTRKIQKCQNSNIA
jgi:hypothetical protein